MSRGNVLMKIGWTAALAVVLMTAVVLGQSSSTASLSGLVTDPQGGVIPGASVSLVNLATGVSREVVSGDDGRYTFPQVPPGAYRLEVKITGFKTLVEERFELPVNTPVVLNTRLELGEIDETVIVTAETSTVNTSDATLGVPFTETQVRQLPLEGRNAVALLSLQPGVNMSGEVNGSRSDQNNITLDGVDVNDQQAPGPFDSVLPITLDSVQEFRVTTANPTAVQGRSSGGQVALVTRSGSNEFHGSVYEFHRNTETTANDFFNNSSGLRRPVLLRNVYGASLGGPIKKERAFFFLNYERRTDRSEQLVTRGAGDDALPTEALRKGTLIYEARPDDARAVPCPESPIFLRILNWH